jgi:hypothetical protein
MSGAPTPESPGSVSGAPRLPDYAVSRYIDTLALDPEALREGFELYRAFDAIIAQNEQRKSPRLTMPVRGRRRRYRGIRDSHQERGVSAPRRRPDV